MAFPQGSHKWIHALQVGPVVDDDHGPSLAMSSQVAWFVLMFRQFRLIRPHTVDGGLANSGACFAWTSSGLEAASARLWTSVGGGVLAPSLV